MLTSNETWKRRVAASLIGLQVCLACALVSAQSDEPLDFLIRGMVVDEAGMPVGGATIESVNWDERARVHTQSRDNGAFVLRVPADGYYGESFLVTDANRERASFVSKYSYTTSNRQPFKVVLQPWRTARVTVVDADGEPVHDAILHLLAEYQVLSQAESDASGQAELRFPADAKVDWICAFKSGEGFDYYENYTAFPTEDRLDVPRQLQLTLNNAASVIVEVLDSDNLPVPNVIVTPWTITKMGKIASLNSSGMILGRTNNEGKALFGWIPADLVGAVAFLVHDEKYHCSENPSYQLDLNETRTLTARVKRVATLRGTVRHADGTPAAGIRMQGEGRGGTNMYFRGHTSTAADGSFEIDIYPDQETILAITDDLYAAASATGIHLKPGEQQDDVNFALNTGTLIHGQLTVGNDRLPMVGATATLIETADKNANLVRWNETDDAGHYRFRVGPGTYDLRLSARDVRQLTVANELEIVHHGHIERTPRGRLEGLLLDAAAQPLAEATVWGESSRNRGHAGFKTKTGPDGRFATERWNDDMLIYAFHASKQLAGFKPILPDDDRVELALSAAASITGRLVDGAGKPHAGREIQLRMSPNDGAGSLFDRTKTDEQGRFAFPAVAVGMAGTVSAPHLQAPGPSEEFSTSDVARLTVELVDAE